VPHSGLSVAIVTGEKKKAGIFSRLLMLILSLIKLSSSTTKSLLKLFEYIIKERMTIISIWTHGAVHQGPIKGPGLLELPCRDSIDISILFC
jgi:hypothetical protein